MKIAVKYLKAGKEADNETVNQVLAAVNGRATAHTIVGAHDVQRVADQAEKYLADHGVRKDLRAGAVVSYTPAGPSANSYRYSTATTRIVLERGSNGWYLVEAHRTDVWPKTPERFSVKITDAAMKYVLEAAANDFGRTLPENEINAALAA